MIKSHFKIAWRNVLKSKGLFSINVIGLAIGLATCLIIALFVVDELSYDRYNEKADEIVRIVFRANIGGEKIKEGGVMAPVAQTLKQNFPEVLDATRIRNMGSQKIIVENNSYRDNKFTLVDPNFFKFFTLPIIEGDTESPLSEPNTAVLTKAEAHKFFGATNPIGRTFHVEGNEEPITVTGIIEEVPKNSHFHFDVFVSMTGLEEAKSNSWFIGNFFTYLQLKEGYAYQNLEAKLPQVVQHNMGPNMLAETGVSFEEFTKNNQIGFILQPLTDIHLYSDNSSYSELEQGGDVKYVYVFSAVALFMLLIACINFMNLSTAAASKRAKEVGIHKVLGSNKKQLRYQFLSESFMITCIAMILAVVFVLLSLPFYNQLSGKELQFDYFLTPSMFLLLLTTTVVISIIAGAYPAFFLSSFKPVTALKNKFAGGGKNKGIRNGLVVFQFMISAGLILATLIVNQQMNYIQNKNLGYDKDQILVIRESHLLGNAQTAFKDELLKNPKIVNLTQSAFVPAGPSDKNQTMIHISGKANRRMPVYNIDEMYLPTMGMQLVAGRNFSKQFGADSTNVIINQTYAKLFGFGNEAIGRTIDEGQNKLTVIGVVKDFHFNSLHQTIEPLLMQYQPYGGLIIRAKTDTMESLIVDIQKVWNSFNTDEVFSYALLDESYRQTYVAEQKIGNILNVFALLTIFVACLGLFGLVTFTAQQRFKEIGIRKVLGSSVSQIVSMLAKDFLKLVVISMGIAFPLGYYFMNKWLEEFAYRIEIKWWVFAFAGLITILIAFLTISYRSILAAKANPVKSLQTE
ncbi:MAG: cell division protein FtsX [Flavobacteriaceae bacterium]|nr:MAG: cell division protein FtsX [Flavobacteriaceae bacterium]